MKQKKASKEFLSGIQSTVGRVFLLCWCRHREGPGVRSVEGGAAALIIRWIQDQRCREDIRVHVVITTVLLIKTSENK